MQQRRFEFQGAAGAVGIALWCREPPETQMGKTLTWQLEYDAADQRATARQAEEQSQDDGGTPATAAAVGPAALPDLIGLDIWPASIALCRYLVSHPELVAGKQVLELGSGMGLLGLLCAALGAQRVVLTDYEVHVLSHLETNVALNNLQQVCSSQALDWRDPGASLGPAQRASWRLIVAADVLYASAVVQPFIDTLQAVLHPSEGVALVGHQVRRAIVLDPATRLPKLEEADEPLEAFKRGCAAAGLALRVLSSRQTCSNCDADPMLLLAVANGQGGSERLAALPVPASEG